MLVSQTGSRHGHLSHYLGLGSLAPARRRLEIGGSPSRLARIRAMVFLVGFSRSIGFGDRVDWIKGASKMTVAVEPRSTSGQEETCCTSGSRLSAKTLTGQEKRRWDPRPRQAQSRRCQYARHVWVRRSAYPGLSHRRRCVLHCSVPSDPAYRPQSSRRVVVHMALVGLRPSRAPARHRLEIGGSPSRLARIRALVFLVGFGRSTGLGDRVDWIRGASKMKRSRQGAREIGMPKIELKNQVLGKARS